MFDGETETDVAPAMQERVRGVGLIMRRPQRAPNTMLVHEATVYAKEKGLDGEFHHVAAGAYWETGADLGKLEVLQGLAEKSGLNWAELSPLLEARHYRDQVFQEYEAAKAKGVGGTPTYMIGGQLLKGDVSLEELQAAVAQASSS